MFALVLDSAPPVDGAARADLVPFPVNALAFLEDVVGGLARPILLDGRRVMWINGNGSRNFAHGPNIVATIIAEQNGSIMPGDFIAGPAVITGETEDGETVALTPNQLRRTLTDFTNS